uniref:FBD domain-containing protein n=1 Tax=Leersia perrieri TaxID=77586 RepID=A0A0D9WPW1_9ORYZ
MHNKNDKNPVALRRQSRRAATLWLSAPLRLHDSDLPPSPSAAISRILSSHRVDAVSFHLASTRARPSAADLDSWLRILTGKRLQDLLLQPPPDPLLPSLLACRSLRSVDLTNRCLPAAPEEATLARRQLGAIDMCPPRAEAGDARLFGRWHPIAAAWGSIIGGGVPKCEDAGMALEMVDPQEKPVIDFLRCFPCLDTLHITPHMVLPRSMEISKCDNMDYPIECLIHHLKKVVLVGYEGRRHELQLATFLLSNARVLHVMKFLCANDCNPTWLTSRRR